jgi:ferredoxin-thioredoxin reductase catalytic chain
LCPCRFYPDKREEIKHRTWICPCDDMQIYKYCHCLLFVNEQGQPVTEHLPEGHEGRAIHGIVPDPTPGKGRALRDQAEEREKERKERPS